MSDRGSPFLSIKQVMFYGSSMIIYKVRGLGALIFLLIVIMHFGVPNMLKNVFLKIMFAGILRFLFCDFGFGISDITIVSGILKEIGSSGK